MWEKSSRRAFVWSNYASPLNGKSHLIATGMHRGCKGYTQGGTVRAVSIHGGHCALPLYSLLRLLCSGFLPFLIPVTLEL